MGEVVRGVRGTSRTSEAPKGKVRGLPAKVKYINIMQTGEDPGDSTT